LVNINYNIDNYSNNLGNYREASFYAQNEEKPKFELATKSNNNSSKQQSKDSLSIGQKQLSDEEAKLVEQLKTIDQKVRAHEQAHLAAGGNLVRGGANFQYQKGPDGKQYAVGGEVQIDASPIPDDPEKTIQKMQQVRRAALAPSDPSPQDRKVAAESSQIEARAAMEKSAKRNTEISSKSKMNKSYLSKYESTNSTPSLKVNRLG